MFRKMLDNPTRRPFLLAIAVATAFTLAACDPADPATDPAGAPPPATAPADPAAPAAPADPLTPADPAAPAPAPATDAATVSPNDAAAVRDQLDEVSQRLDAAEARLATLAETEEAEGLATEAREEVEEARNILADARQQLDAMANGAATTDADAPAADDADAEDAEDDGDDAEPLAPADPSPAN